MWSGRITSINCGVTLFRFESPETKERVCFRCIHVCLHRICDSEMRESFGVLVNEEMCVCFHRENEECFFKSRTEIKKMLKSMRIHKPQKLHICFQFSWNQIRASDDPAGTNTPFPGIIFSFKHVWSVLLLEKRPASEMPPSRPFPPLSVSVCGTEGAGETPSLNTRVCRFKGQGRPYFIQLLTKTSRV